MPLGKGIIGALNYLHSREINSLYMLLMNLGGDSRDVAPFANIGTDPCSPNASVMHYSVARMREWNIVFEHAMRKGIALDLVLSEMEISNIHWLGGSILTGGNAMSPERKLFLKHMVAMFGHNHAIKWILTEELIDEDAQGHCESASFSRPELTAMANWIRDWDIHQHPITVHTTGFPWVTYDRILDDHNPPNTDPAWLSGTSLQVGGEFPLNPWVDFSKFSTNYSWHPRWVRKLFDTHLNAVRTPVDIDENGHFGWGASRDSGSNHIFNHHDGSSWVILQGIPSLNDSNDRRRRVLYDVLFAGAGLAWYYGISPTHHAGLPLGGDHSLEEFDTRDLLFQYTRHARKLITEYPTTNIPRPEWFKWEPFDQVIVTGCNSVGQQVDILGGIANSYWNSPPALHAAYIAFVQPLIASFGDPSDTQACELTYGQPRAFAKVEGDALVHYPRMTGGAGTIHMYTTWNLTTTEAKYAAKWWDPRTGLFLADAPSVFYGSTSHSMPLPSPALNPTYDVMNDYVLVIERLEG